MATPFILRFQEVHVEAEDTRFGSGTRSITAVRAEQDDKDPYGNRFGALGQASKGVGTMTKTFVHVEEPDKYRALSPFGLTSVAAVGTQTMTRMRAEHNDADPGERQLRVFSQCSSF